MRDRLSTVLPAVAVGTLVPSSAATRDQYFAQNKAQLDDLDLHILEFTHFVEVRVGEAAMADASAAHRRETRRTL